MRHSRRVSGITNLSLNSIDVLSGLETLKICVAYDLMVSVLTTTLQVWSNSNVANQSMKKCQVGLKTSQVCVSLDELPEAARNYVRRISELVGVRISTFSVGPT